VRFEFDAWRGETTASLHLLRVGYLEEERDERAKALGEAVAAADKLERDISTLKEAMASQQAASLDKVKSLTAEMQDEAARRMEEAAAALADREAEIAGLREKLKETELAKEQLLADMSQALGLKDAAEKARAESTMEAAERAGIGARELSKVAGELEGARAEIAGLREKLKETELAKEQLLTDMSQALGLKEEELGRWRGGGRRMTRRKRNGQRRCARG
jgi:chromosome segregation ATPase